ncbi:MAG TPA: tRNA (adenosine(37)-N6)-threonylcarbamoyltransferase complex dimerization subunit type 1 TsaB [Acidimicrobiales bacterium]|nr:tRNA (adenosine(37)-N6)-threonylcarbamoyltransferase complex dimerization subunit type 1 TsaB [Acidimicrobiales bacterium]
MTVLALETATSAVATALADEGRLLAAFEVGAGRRHAELLHVAVLATLEAAGIDFADLSAVAVDLGPGLFTGIRVGVAAAKGYAMALGLPVIGFTSLEILELGCEAAGCGTAVGVVDLRRGEVAWSLPAEAGRTRVERHGPPADLVADLAAYLERLDRRQGGAPPVLAGDGAIRYRSLFIAALGERIALAGAELSVPPVRSLALGAVSALAAGGGMEASAVRPVYLRDADVRIGWTTRHDAPGRQTGVA